MTDSAALPEVPGCDLLTAVRVWSSLKMNNMESRAEDRVEEVSTVVENTARDEQLLKEGRWKEDPGGFVVKAIVDGIWPEFLREQVAADVVTTNDAKTQPDIVIDIMRKNARAYRLVEDYEIWKTEKENRKLPVVHAVAAGMRSFMPSSGQHHDRQENRRSPPTAMPMLIEIDGDVNETCHRPPPQSEEQLKRDPKTADDVDGGMSEVRSG